MVSTLLLLRTFFHLFLSCTLLLGVPNIAHASTDRNAPTLVALDQKINIPAQETATVYFAVDLKFGQSVTIFARRTAGTQPRKMSIYRPDPIEGKSPTQQYINEGLYFQLASAITGRYLLEFEPSQSDTELVIYQSFAEPTVNEQLRTEHFNRQTSSYLQSGQYQLTNMPRIFRFEARQGDNIKLLLQNIRDAQHLKMTVFAFEQRKEGFYDYEPMPNISGHDIQFVANVTTLYFVEIEHDYRYPKPAQAEFKLTVDGIRPDTDDDQDGLSNTAEYYQGTDPQNVDTNQNNQSDYEDILAGNSASASVTLQHSDLVNASSAETAKAIPYFDKPFKFWTLDTNRFFSAELKRGYIYEQVETRQDKDCCSTSNTLIAATKPGLRIWNYATDYNDAHHGRSYEWAIYNSFANPDVTDQQRQFAKTNATSFYLQAGEFDSRKVTVQRFEARRGERVRFKVTALKHFPETDAHSWSMSFAVRAGKDSRVVPIQYIDESQVKTGIAQTFDFVAARTDVYFLTITGSGRYKVEPLQLRADADDDQDGLSNTTELYRGLDLADADTNNNGTNDAEDIRQGRFGVYPLEWDYSQVQEATSEALAVEVPLINQKFTIANVTGNFALKIPVKANQPFTILQKDLALQYASGDKIKQVRPQKDGWYYHYVDANALSPHHLMFGIFMSFGSANPAATAEFNSSYYSARPLTADLYQTDQNANSPMNSVATTYFRFEAIANQRVTLNLQLENIEHGDKRLIMNVDAPVDQTKSDFWEQLPPVQIASASVTKNKTTAQISFLPPTSGTYYLNFTGSSFGSAPPNAHFRIVSTGVPPERDSDQDGLSNTAEYLIGSDPFIADSNQNGQSDLVDLQQNGYPQWDTSLLLALQQQGLTADTALPLPQFNREYVLKANTPRYLSFAAKAGERFFLRTDRIAKGGQDKVTASICLRRDSECTPISDFNNEVNIAETGNYLIRLTSPRLNYTADTIFALYQSHDTPGIYDDSRKLYAGRYIAMQLQPGYHQMKTPNLYLRFYGKKDVNVQLRLTAQNGGSPAFGAVSAAIYDSGDGNKALSSNAFADTQTLQFTPQQDGIFYLSLYSGANSLPGVWIEPSGIELAEYAVSAQSQPINGGTAVCSPAIVPHGQTAVCTATPTQGYQFSHWSQEACGSATECKLAAVVRPQQLQAYFRAIYSLDVQVENQQGGKLISGPGQVLAGSNATFVFAPEAGYRISRKVSGTCPPGRWVDANTYEIGPVGTNCQVSFKFEKVAKPDGLPWWVLMAAKTSS